jgi:hypothetical protein
VESQSGTRGWRGYEADDEEILFFCRGCSEREFEGGGGDRHVFMRLG